MEHSLQEKETVQQRNMRVGYGCNCHGETFCPDLEFSHYEDDQPVYRTKRSSTEKEK